MLVGQPCGFLGAYHPAVLGSNPKHTIYAFSFIVKLCAIFIVNRTKRDQLCYSHLELSDWMFKISSQLETFNWVKRKLTLEIFFTWLARIWCHQQSLEWNKALWLVVPSHVTSFSQSECFISVFHRCTMTSVPGFIFFLKKMGQSCPLFVDFRSFLITISIIQIEKA